jgi:hypothetical protein
MLRRAAPVFVPKLKQTASLVTNLGETARSANGLLPKKKTRVRSDDLVFTNRSK